MKIICKQENLIKGLQKTIHITGKNFNLPILNNILLNVEKGNVELSATNLEIGIKTQIRGKVEKEGKITFPAKVLTEYINLIDGNENITLEIKKDNLEISTEKGWKTKIKTVSADDFPLIPDLESNKEIKIKVDSLRKALLKVMFAVSLDETRPELTGILFIFKEDSLILVGTDGYKMSEYKIPAKNDFEDKIIVPLKTVQELSRVLGEKESGEVKVFFDDNQIKFEIDETIIISRLIEGEYPDYKQIIPLEFVSEFEISKDEIVKAIKASSIFTKVGVFDISIEFGKGFIEVSSINAQVGENKIKIDNYNFSGEDGKIIFNYKFLLDGLSAMNGDKIKFFVNSVNNPVIFRSGKDENFLYLVMPIRQ
jgi:DNA polymerase III subunit beta